MIGKKLEYSFLIRNKLDKQVVRDVNIDKMKYGEVVLGVGSCIMPERYRVLCKPIWGGRPVPLVVTDRPEL